jgi:Ser/Thr protein kinase RdoA (MazF antagonist)
VKLRDWVADVTGDLVGPDAEVVDWLVDHHERCVGKIAWPDGRRAVLKADTDPARTARERAVLAAAHAAGLAVPAIRCWEPGPPAALVLDWVDGTWLEPGRAEPAWANVGAQLRRLHQVPVDDLGFYAGAEDWGSALAGRLDDQWDTAHRLDLDDVVSRADRALVDLLAIARPPIGTLHGDCVPIHVRLDPDDQVQGLLDFGDTMRGDVAWDLTVLTLRSPRRLGAVLEGYQADPALRRWLGSAVPAYRVLRHLSEAVWLADHGYNPAAAIRSTRAAVEGLPGG